MTMKERLKRLLFEKSFMYSEEPTFNLVSGKKSNFYFNCKPTTLDPEGMYLIGHLVFENIQDLKPDGIGGLTFGADPIAMATAFTSQIKGMPIKAFSVRKEQKDHGIVRWIEGDLKPGERVVIVDDVATTGGSTIKAIERARAEGMEVIKAVVLIDRQEGGLDRVKEHISPAIGGVEAIVTRDDMMALYYNDKGKEV
ncbi:MAG: orotate phosphoribosyltransferase [Pseudomonadota bacterium]